MTVGTDQDYLWSCNRSDHWKLPRANVSSVNTLHAVRPRIRIWGDVEVTGLTKVEQERPRLVQQREDALRTICGREFEIGHATSEQRMAVAKVVPDIEAGHHGAKALAGFVETQKVRHAIAQRANSQSRNAPMRSSARNSAICATALRNTSAAIGCRSA